MKQMLYKEFRLALHPVSVLFLVLSAMVMIPNYPYYVVFFYTCLGIFFICQNGRENQDIFYMMLLPVAKADVVRARMTMAVILQLAQMGLAVPFVILRNAVVKTPNLAGMDANVALFGLGFLMLGLFNAVFFTRYYRDPNKVGVAFIYGSAVIFAFIVVAEGMALALPPFRSVLDTPDPQNMAVKLAVLAGGALLYCLLTAMACKKAVRSFETIDL